MSKRAKTVSINLRMPADLHKQLVEAAAAASPTHSLNSEILARLFESFDTEVQFEELEGKVKAYAIKRIKEAEQIVETRVKALEENADKFIQKMERVHAKTLELHRRAEAKLKQS